jgi:hypothetical protein
VLGWRLAFLRTLPRVDLRRFEFWFRTPEVHGQKTRVPYWTDPCVRCLGSAYLVRR